MGTQVLFTSFPKSHPKRSQTAPREFMDRAERGLRGLPGRDPSVPTAQVLGMIYLRSFFGKMHCLKFEIISMRGQEFVHCFLGTFWIVVGCFFWG